MLEKPLIVKERKSMMFAYPRKHVVRFVAVVLVVVFVLSACSSKADKEIGQGDGNMSTREDDYVFRREYEFSGTMPRNVLESYLSRSVNHLGLCSGSPEQPTSFFEDDLRMLINIGAKFIGRAAYAWSTPANHDKYIELARERAALMHQADPEIILQACIFEAIYKDLERIPIPEWVFEEFGLEPQDRTFSFEAMLYDDGSYRDLWGTHSGVPDMTKLETQMWFFYWAARYIDAGYEAIHFGQVHLMSKVDLGHISWFDILARIRMYAKHHARRGVVLCDAHTHGIVQEGKLLFDFHSFPLRPKEVVQNPRDAILSKNYLDSIYGKSLGGITPSGWYVESLPYLVELDNCGISNTPGSPTVNQHWIWGYDEISWFAHQAEEYRNQWLEYAWSWIRANDPNGWLQFITRRTIAHAPVTLAYGPGTVQASMYYANSQSRKNPYGFNQEDTIKAIWERDR